MTKKAAKSDVAIAEAPAVEVKKIVAYKGFDANLVCNPNGTPFQYEIGKSYEVEGLIKACRNGFHACERPTDVFGYYPAAGGTRYCEVILEGDIDVDGDKTAARKITIVRELTLTEFINLQVEYTVSRTHPEGEKASGEQGAATASGEQGAATASGYQGAATASGYQGAATASGEHSAAMGSGFDGRARGREGSAVFLVERAETYADDHGKILHVWAGIVGQDGIKPNTFYRLVEGKPVEVAE
jgi:hypothetical protein